MSESSGERDTGLETLAQRDARLNAWLAGVRVGDIVTVRLNSTDTLTGKVYEAPDDSGRTALYVYTTLLRYGNGYPGGSFEPGTPIRAIPPGETTPTPAHPGTTR